MCLPELTDVESIPAKTVSTFYEPNFTADKVSIMYQ